jgi:hypothetical protein
MKIAPDRCPTCRRVKKRSNESNRRYWLILHLVADKVIERDPDGYVRQQWSAETWHIYFKLRYLGGTDIALPNGKTIVQPKSTADLDKGAFADYMMRVEMWAQEHGVFLDEEVAA